MDENSINLTDEIFESVTDLALRLDRMAYDFEILQEDFGNTISELSTALVAVEEQLHSITLQLGSLQRLQRGQKHLRHTSRYSVGG